MKKIELCFANGKKVLLSTLERKNKFNKLAKNQGWKLTCMFVEKERRSSVCWVKQ